MFGLCQQGAMVASAQIGIGNLVLIAARPTRCGGSSAGDLYPSVGKS